MAICWNAPLLFFISGPMSLIHFKLLSKKKSLWKVNKSVKPVVFLSILPSWRCDLLDYGNSSFCSNPLKFSDAAFIFLPILRQFLYQECIDTFTTFMPSLLQKVVDSQSSKSFVWRSKISTSPKRKGTLWIVMWLGSKTWHKWENLINFLSIDLEEKMSKRKKKDIWQIYAVASVQTHAVWSVPTQRSTHASIIPRLL